MNDSELLAASAGGDADAFATFYRRHLGAVVAFCRNATGSADTAADLTAEVFAAALSGAARYRPEQDSAVAWLRGIARNKCSTAAGEVGSRKLPNGHVVPRQVIAASELIANVEGNVAAVEKPVHGGLLPSATIWLAADGHVIKTFRYAVSRPPRHLPELRNGHGHGENDRRSLELLARRRRFSGGRAVVDPSRPSRTAGAVFRRGQD